MNVAGLTLHQRQPIQHLAQLGLQQIDVDTGFCQQVANHAARLVQHGRQQVYRLDKLVLAANRQRLGVRQRELKFACQFVHPHGRAPVSVFLLLLWGRGG